MPSMPATAQAFVFPYHDDGLEQYRGVDLCDVQADVESAQLILFRPYLYKLAQGRSGGARQFPVMSQRHQTRIPECCAALK